jgi:hypothetical protein
MVSLALFFIIPVAAASNKNEIKELEDRLKEDINKEEI